MNEKRPISIEAPPYVTGHAHVGYTKGTGAGLMDAVCECGWSGPSYRDHAYVCFLMDVAETVKWSLRPDLAKHIQMPETGPDR